MDIEGDPQQDFQHDQKLYPVMHFNGDCAAALDLYKDKLGAEIPCVMKGDKGYVHHAVVKMPGSDTWIMCCDDHLLMQGKVKAKPGRVYVTVSDVDKLYKAATEAGFKAIESVYSPSGKPTDMFWGVRAVALEDPYGHEWALVQSNKDPAYFQSEEFAEQQKAYDSEYP